MDEETRHELGIIGKEISGIRESIVRIEEQLKWRPCQQHEATIVTLGNRLSSVETQLSESRPFRRGMATIIPGSIVALIAWLIGHFGK